MVCLQKLKWCGFENLCGWTVEINWLWFVCRNQSSVVLKICVVGLYGNQTGSCLCAETEVVCQRTP